MRSLRGSHLLRTGAAAAVVAVVAAGCGAGGQPVVTSGDEVTAALAALAEQSMRASVTASIEVDEGELRALMREDDELLALIAEGFDLVEEPVDVDELISLLTDAQDELARWRLELAVGDDESWQLAVETDDTVWLDVRNRTSLDPAALATGGADVLAPFELDIQLMLDLVALGDVLASYDAGDELDVDVADARDQLAALRDGGLFGQDVAPLFELADALLAGGLVQIGGELDLRRWLESVAGPLGATPEDIEELIEESTVTGEDATNLTGDLEGFVDTAFTFDDYRTEDALTVVDVTIELRAALEFLSEAYDEVAGGRGDGDLGDDARAELDAAIAELPVDRLVDVAELRFGPDGVLQQARIDVLGMLMDIAAAVEGDEDLATVAEAYATLERTGAFLTIDIVDVGQVPTVLGQPDADVTWDELRAIVETQVSAFGPLFLGPGALGGGVLGGDLGDGGGFLGDGDGFLGGDGGLDPSELAVGDCFDDGALFGAVPSEDAVVACTEPHDNEVFAIVEVAPPGTPYDLALLDTAYEACDAAFEPYVGTPYIESVFFYGVIQPRPERWDAGETAAACYLYSFDRETGSAAGSGR